MEKMNMEKQNMLNDRSRRDREVPLTRLGIPAVDMEKLRERMQLPDQFLRTCTLKEGAWIVVLSLNGVAALMITFLLYLLYVKPEETEAWWKERFRDDFDYYYRDENQDIINTLYPLWRPVAFVIIGAKGVYFFTGLLCMYALLKKNAHPCWYMPWLIVTFLLLLVQWLMGFVMFICMWWLMVYREVTVTWDFGPIICVCVYGIFWSYAWFVVIAHHRRRRIVRYWKNLQRSTGSDTLGPQY